MSSLSLRAEDKTFQEELAEWDNINKLLKRHGCNPVCVSKPQELQNFSGAVGLDLQASVAVRCAMKSLVEDTERRQNLLQGLIQTNNQLKDDVRQQQGRATRQEQKAKDLQHILDSVKTKIQELEDDFIAKTSQQQNQMKTLLKEKQMVHEQSQKHREKLQEQEDYIAKLKKQLSEAVTAEEKSAASQRKAFLRIVSRPPRDNNKVDQEILDVIDVYEKQVSRLQKELRKYKVIDIPDREEKSYEDSLDLDTTPNYRALLKSYQEQMRQAKEKHEQLVRENSTMKTELEGRPTVREFKHYKQLVRRLEKILLQNNISVRGVRTEKNEETWAEPPSTKVKDLEQLPAGECRRYLQGICRDLNVEDLRDLVSFTSAKARKEETCAKLHQILSDISSVLSSHRAPQLLYKHSGRLQSSLGLETSNESEFVHLLPTVEMWAAQLQSLKTLHRTLRKLSEELLPYQQRDEKPEPADSVRVEDLLLLVDTMMEDLGSKGKDSSRPSPHTLHALVSHFQKLFDVPSMSGVYPRMNELYSKLGEMSNAMRNMRCLLGIDDRAASGALVNAVYGLCREVEEGESQKIQQVLGTLDIDSVINKIQEHDEFFPAFDELIKRLLDILEISSLDEILPAVYRLKQASP
ncbi:centrosomal protein of 70 kDa [Discoglossus pictus]